MAAITATLDTRPLSAALARIGKATGTRLLYRSLNEGADGMRSEATRAVREDLNATARAVRKSMHVKKARGRGAAPAVDLTVEMKPLPLGAFQARQTAKGATFKVKKGGGRKVIPRTFVATMKSGHKGVYRRVRVGKKRVGRLPIEELKTASVGSSLSAQEIRRRVLRAGRERFERELKNQIVQAVRKTL